MEKPYHSPIQCLAKTKDIPLANTTKDNQILTL